MIILGVDPGSLVTGVAVLAMKGNSFQALEGHAIRLGTQELGEKLLTLEKELLARIDSFKPEVMAVEKVFHGVNVRSSLLLGHVRGVILLCAARRGLPVEEYAPAEVKKAVVGTGRADKEQVQYMVRQLLGLRELPKPHDIADAYALAICHAHCAPMRHLALQHGLAERHGWTR